MNPKTRMADGSPVTQEQVADDFDRLTASYESEIN